MINITSCTLQCREDFDNKFRQEDTKECQICCQCYRLEQFYSIGCQHYFCRQCLTSFITQQITQFYALRCCQEGCSQIMDHSQHSIYHELSNKLKKRVDLLLDNFDRINNVRTCKSCNSGALIQKINGQNKRILQCNSCHMISCYNCFGIAHEAKCTNLQTLEYPPDCGQCRKCKSIVLKNVGCSHVKCICGYQFCYECSYHWDPSHICQYKLQKRTGCSKWLCNFVKVILAIPISIFLAGVYVIYMLIVCLLSSFMLAVLGWLKVLQDQLRSTRVADAQISKKNQNNSSNALNCFLILIWLVFFPIAGVVLAVGGFFLPFWNLCYNQKIVLPPTILADLWHQIQSWIDIYLVL